jgi:outer membrane protein TolC
VTSRINRDIADTRLRESLVQTTASVKTAYWNLVSAIANVDARRSSLELSQELTRVNRAKVDVGQSPALDLLSAQAEVAANEEQLIIAETAVKQAEDRLRMLIFDPTDREIWNVKIEPVDTPPVGTMAPDVDAAVTTALRDRADLLRARKDVDSSAATLAFADNQRLPDVRASLTYTASGLGGTQVLRAVPFGPVTSTGAVTGFGSILGQVLTHDYPTWVVGVSLTYPLGQTSDQAAFTRARLEREQATERLKGAEARAIQQVRDAAWKIEMNARRIDTTRVARELAEQRLDAERKRFEVGMSTSFLVIQAQRDLAQAKQNELAAVLAYDLSLVDFEALQQAGPAGSGGAAGGTGATAGAATGGAPAASTAAAAPGGAGARIPGAAN